MRLKDNLEILKILKSYFKRNPDIRFYQGLLNLGITNHIVDLYYEEPIDTLKRMLEEK